MEGMKATTLARVENRLRPFLIRVKINGMIVIPALWAHFQI